MLADTARLLNVMKLAGMRAVDAGMPVNIEFGTVSATEPLKIDVEQKMTLESSQLILTRSVTDYTAEMSIDHYTENETAHTHAVHDTYTGGGSSSPTSHLHAITGRKSFTIHNALKVGERVLLIREQGGQRYIVIDRI